MQVACVVLGDARDPGFQTLVDRCAELDRGSVRADVDRLAALHAQALGIPRGELDLRRGPLFSGAAVERVAELQFQRPAPEIELSARDAKRLGVKRGASWAIQASSSGAGGIAARR